MKEARYYKKVDGDVQCELCPRMCRIKQGMHGFCGVRKNVDGTLYSLSYGQPVSINMDPIEKKPLFHFLPGEQALSVGTVGCNLSCKFCQNFQISQADHTETKIHSPKDIVELAKKKNCKIISFTYNEPTVFYEYMIEIAMLAQDANIKTMMVSNGFINEKPLRELCSYLDAANIDLKAFNDDFYQKLCAIPKLEYVLKTLKVLKEMGVWIEITNLVIPTMNDNIDEIEKMCVWIEKNLGKNTPLHFTRFFPMYKMENVPPTAQDFLIKSQEIAQKHLSYVYVGNILTEKGEKTYCAHCSKLLIGRSGFGILMNNIRDGKCASCREAVAGVWE